MTCKCIPTKINDSALDARLDPLLTLRMSTKEIAEDFPDPQEINQVRNGKKAMPSDPGRRAIFQVQLARLEERESAERKRMPAKPWPRPLRRKTSNARRQGQRRGKHGL